jgi:hypothetical protein
MGGVLPQLAGDDADWDYLGETRLGLQPRE